MFPTQLFILFLLLNSVYGASKQSHFKQKLTQLSKTLTPDYDNRYVWFTRNIHSEKQNQDEFRKKIFNRFFYRKDSTVNVEKLFTT